MKRIFTILLAGVGLGLIAAIGYNFRPQNHEQLPSMVVYKSPTCGCCAKWVEHMEKAGFEVDSRDMRDMNSIKTQLGVPRRAASCHTAVVGGYIVEGHVPAEFVHQLLEEKPEIAGIAVPGMPIGSPGMEGPDPTPYEVMTLVGDSIQGIYARVTP